MASPYAQKGNNLHYDSLNGGTGSGLPTELQNMYPKTKFDFARRGQPGADVAVTGGVHPSDTSVYPNTKWPAGYDQGDFKPNTPRGRREFRHDRNKGKYGGNPTVMIAYDANGKIDNISVP